MIVSYVIYNSKNAIANQDCLDLDIEKNDDEEIICNEKNTNIM